MDETAQAATNNNAPADGATNDAAAVNTPQPVNIEAPINDQTPQEDVDAIVNAALGDEFAEPAPADQSPAADAAATNDGTKTPEELQAEADAKAKADADAAAAANADDKKGGEAAKPTKGYTSDDSDTKKSVDDAVKEAEDLQKATIDTADLFIEIEDAEGKAVKITLDGGVPDDIKFASDKQLYDVMEAMQEMRGMKEERLKELHQRQTEAQGKADSAKTEQERIKGWDDEISTLIDSGLLEAPKAEVSDPAFKDDPTVQRVNQVFDFMAAENEQRLQSGKPLIQSFSTAFTMLANKEAKEAEAQKVKQGNDDAKAAGSIVGGSSAASGGSQNVYVAGSATSIYDVPL